jgi:MFS family permease
MIPLTVGFLFSAPLSGMLSDKVGVRFFTVGGALITGVSFALLLAIPVNFSYWAFAVLLAVNGIGSGMFASPNRAEIMNAVPADQRGVGAGMNATFMNASMVLSIGIFFSLMVIGLSDSLPSAMQSGLTAQGVPGQAAQAISHLPPIAVLFAAFLGYNPMQQLLGPELHRLPADHASYLTGRSFFPHLITQPFHNGLVIAFCFAIVACVVAAVASMLTKRQKTTEHESLGSELAGVSGEAGLGLSELAVPHMSPNGERPSAGGLGGARATTIGGFVHDGAGTPIPYAAITIAGPDGRQLGRTNTGPDGRYALEAPPGDYLVIVTALGRAPEAAAVLVGVGGAVHDFALAVDDARPVGEMRGVVRSPHGMPLGGITTTVTDESGEVVATTTTGDNGTYRITGLADGHYTLVAAGHRPATVTVQVGAGEPATVRVALGE